MIIVFGTIGIFTNAYIFRNSENLLTDNITVCHNVVVFLLARIRLANNGDTILLAKLIQLFLRIFTKLCSASVVISKEYNINLVSIGIVFVIIKITVFAREAVTSELGIGISHASVKVVFRHHCKIIEIIID